jgi:methyl-accepting chemotaxis protein
MKLADQAGHSLQEIVKISQKVMDMITQIAVSSEQQSATSEQISQNVEVIHTVSKQMANSTREVVSASEGLKHLTEQLQETVNQFKLDEDEQNRDARSSGIIRKQLL